MKRLSYLFAILFLSSLCKGNELSFYAENPVFLTGAWRNLSCGAALGGLPSVFARLDHGNAYWHSYADGGNFQGSLIVEQSGVYTLQKDELVIDLNPGQATKQYLLSGKKEPGIAPARRIRLSFIPQYNGFMFFDDLHYAHDSTYKWNSAESRLDGPDCLSIPVFQRNRDRQQLFGSLVWARFVSQNPGGFLSTSQTDRDSHIRQAKELHAEGAKAFQNKDIAKSIKLFESALLHQPSAAIYYDYGNSLASTNQLDAAWRAYYISKELKPDNPELVDYNIACVLSRSGSLESAMRSLREALNEGYDAFDYMAQDPDLEALRKSDVYKQPFKDLIAEYSKRSQKTSHGNM